MTRLSEKVLYKGWLPVDDELDDSSEEELRLHLESLSCTSITNSLWLNLLAYLHALQFIHQSAHWTCKGDQFYGDHLLFQRAYEQISKEIDQVAEKALGFGADETLFDPSNLLLRAAASAKLLNQSSDLIQAAFLAEKTFIQQLEAMIQAYSIANDRSSGGENLLQSIADQHESLVYLLSRRVGEETTIKVCIQPV